MAAVTIKDLAEQLGVSPATVSLALNDRPGVNEETKQMVLKLADELGYTNTIAKKTPTQQGVINFLVYRKFGRIITNTHFFARLMEAGEKAARLHHYTLSITYCDGQEQLSSCVSGAAQGNAMGILVLGTEMSHDDIPILEKSVLPVVILDNELPASPFDMISIHNIDGIWRAVEHLKERGLTDIGYLRSSVPITNFDMRYMGYTYSLHKIGQDVDYQKVFRLAPAIEEAQEDMKLLLGSNVKIPKALIADNDLIALGAARAMQEAGLKIPEDVSVIGFDNIPLAEYALPALTSIEVSCEELGTCAVNALIKRLKDHTSQPQNIAVGTRLIARNSVTICQSEKSQ